MDVVPVIIIATVCVLVLVGSWIAWRRMSSRPGHAPAVSPSPAELADQSAEHQRNLTQLLHRYQGDSTHMDDSNGQAAAHDVNA